MNFGSVVMERGKLISGCIMGYGIHVFVTHTPVVLAMQTPSPDDDCDEVILEVRRIKEELARKFNFDVRAMAADARERQWKSGHKVVSFAKPRDVP
jgi:hypothetical protein